MARRHRRARAAELLGQGEAMDPGADGWAQAAHRRHRWLGILQAAGPESFHWQSAATGWLWLRAPTSAYHLPGQGGLLVTGEVAGKFSCGQIIYDIAPSAGGHRGRRATLESQRQKSVSWSDEDHVEHQRSALSRRQGPGGPAAHQPDPLDRRRPAAATPGQGEFRQGRPAAASRVRGAWRSCAGSRSAEQQGAARGARG